MNLTHSRRTLALWTLCGLICVAQSAMAKSRRPTAPNGPSADISAAPSRQLPAYIVLGHHRRIQELRVHSLAWTLGADGFVIRWAENGEHWIPTAVHRVPTATCMQHSGATIRVYGADGVQVLDDTTLRATAHQNTHASSTEACLRNDVSDEKSGPDTHVVTSKILQNVLVTPREFFLVFADGWYAYTPDSNAADVHPTTRRKWGHHQQRIWIDGDISASGVRHGDAHVAVCQHRDAKVRLLDLNLTTGETSVVWEHIGPCPPRVTYTSDGLMLSFDDKEIRPSSPHSKARDGVYLGLKGPIPAHIQARAMASRGCAYRAWELTLHTPILKDVSMLRDLCARSAMGLRWHSENASGQGPGIVFTGAFGTVVWMIDETTLQRFSIRLPVRLSPRVRILRNTDGSWLFANPETGRAHHVSAGGRLAGKQDVSLLHHRIWKRTPHGVLERDDGHRLLVTDRGAVLDDIGIGPVSGRTVRRDVQRIPTSPARFFDQLRRVFGTDAAASSSRAHRMGRSAL